MKEGVSLLGAKKERNFELCTQLKSNNTPNVDSYIQTEGRPFHHTGHDTLRMATKCLSVFIFQGHRRSFRWLGICNKRIEI